MAETRKIKLLTLLKILYEQTDDSHPLSAPQLIELLAQNGIACERKAIYRDIESLGDFGFDIEKSTSPAGFYWGERLFETPELLMLADSVKSSGFITEKKSAELIERFKRLASRYEAKKLDMLEGIVGRPKNRNEDILYSIDALHRALLEKRKVRFAYYHHIIRNGRVTARKTRDFTVSPYALIWNDGKYYLVANYGKYDNLSHYRIDRMKGVDVLTEPCRPLSECSDYGDSFDEADYISRIFDMYAGSYEDYVYLRCSMDSLDHLVDRFGQDMMCETNGENYFTVRVLAVVNDGLVSWILAQRGKVSVVYPPELAQMVRQTLTGMLRQYGTEME